MGHSNLSIPDPSEVSCLGREGVPHHKRCASRMSPQEGAGPDLCLHYSFECESFLSPISLHPRTLTFLEGNG